MSIVNDKYRQLLPTLDYLSDPVVLAQAWKKSHSYIRSHNWYADTLELDASAVNLEQNLHAWGRELADQRYRAAPMRLVPAPKTDTWSIKQTRHGWEWLPSSTKAKSTKGRGRAALSEPLRPLAHLTIKDQTIASAMMMCMANAVETAQGPTDGDRSRVSSFGNRLYCVWDDQRARFGWGNSTTYSKYFQDYQRFLKRTTGSARNIELFNTFFSTSKRDIYEVQLDMSAFYDSVDRQVLLTKLRAIVDRHHGLYEEETESFWTAVSRCFFSWTWYEKDFKLQSCLKVPLSNNGLPQGLVASGFFANAYLHDFDVACRALVNASFDAFIIHDYCRYVDDLRLIISIEAELDTPSLEKIKQKIVTMMGLLLPTEHLKLNPDKTKLIRLSGEESDVASQMQNVQTIISGPMDMDSLMHVERSLDSLFLRAEVVQSDAAESNKVVCPHPLATVHQAALDVREDTVLRFAANRWAKIFKARRRLVSREELHALDATQEAVARRFIASWAKNPALTLLLKKGLQLFPSPELLSAVWEPLVAKLQDNTPLREQCIASYCLAEICRFSVTDMRRLPPSDLPKAANVFAYQELLETYVRRLVTRKNLPWYLLQQSGLLLVGRRDVDDMAVFASDTLLHRVMMLSDGRAFGSADAVIPAAFVAWQISADSSKVLTALVAWLETLPQIEKVLSVEAIAVNNPELFSELAEYSRRGQSGILALVNQIEQSLGLSPTDIFADVSDWSESLTLSAVIRSPNNPFVHENALIKLALAVIEQLPLVAQETLSPQSLSISCTNWRSAQNPTAASFTLHAIELSGSRAMDRRYVLPAWLPDEGDARALYQLGSLLRACALGNCDFTVSHMLYREDVSDTYQGLKSSWYKRRMGMMHSPETLVGETAPMSGWITELLFALLQWPGLDMENERENWLDVMTLASLRTILVDRLAYQKRLYGVASDMPFYVQSVKCFPDTRNVLRVVSVQSLLPKQGDFERHGIELDDKDYRDKHRGHLTDLCNLILKKLGAMEFASDQKIATSANLIVFPELSVHQDDVDLLEALSAKTKAMIFAGIVFHEHVGKKINRALWLIPYQTRRGGLRWIKRWQGKWNMTKLETAITPWRPYQLVIELEGTLPHLDRGFRLSGAICYDATDMKLTADLRDHSDVFLIAALNKDITTFDNMIDALHYHMYQHVVLVNSGEFGGSAAKAPFKLPHHRTLAQSHGGEQISISVFDIELTSLMADGAPAALDSYQRLRKTKPAGLQRSGLS